jgi:hypothetical protein
MVGMLRASEALPCNCKTANAPPNVGGAATTSFIIAKIRSQNDQEEGKGEWCYPSSIR